MIKNAALEDWSRPFFGTKCHKFLSSTPKISLLLQIYVPARRNPYRTMSFYRAKSLSIISLVYEKLRIVLFINYVQEKSKSNGMLLFVSNIGLDNKNSCVRTVKTI
jgi:hypothetical protein